MDPLEIMAWRRKIPFQPFRIYLADGSSYPIRLPEHIGVSRRTILIGVKPIDGIPLSILPYSPQQVERIEPLKAAGHNGRKKKKTG